MSFYAHNPVSIMALALQADPGIACWLQSKRPENTLLRIAIEGFMKKGPRRSKAFSLEVHRKCSIRSTMIPASRSVSAPSS